MTTVISRPVLFVVATMLATLCAPASAYTENRNITIQEGRVNINRTYQCGDSNANVTYQSGRININRTVQRCGHNRNQTVQFGKSNRNETDQGRSFKHRRSKANGDKAGSNDDDDD